MKSLQLPHIPSTHRRIFGKAIRCSRWVFDVIHQPCSTAVNFEIEISALRPGLNEKFDATIATNRLLELRCARDDVTILHIEPQKQVPAIVQQSRLCSWPMIAALRVKMANIGYLRRLPYWMVPIIQIAGDRKVAVNVTDQIGKSHKSL
jgi:hypothetical protein